jgi:hypothetical protein
MYWKILKYSIKLKKIHHSLKNIPKVLFDSYKNVFSTLFLLWIIIVYKYGFQKILNPYLLVFTILRKFISIY